MALDAAMAEHCLESGNISTLRVYGWQPHAISLGFHQSPQDLDLEKCRRNEIDVVVRPTGGRAILHADEITYAVIIPRSSRHFDREILKVYELISQCLIAALRRLRINVSFERARSTPKDFSRGELSSLCYASSVQYEINYQNRKLIGSAQRRFEHAILQHGSILVGPKHLDLADYLAHPDLNWKKAVRRYMARNTLYLNELSPEPLTYPTLAQALRQGFSEYLGIELATSEISEREWQIARNDQRFAILRNQKDKKPLVSHL